MKAFQWSESTVVKKIRSFHWYENSEFKAAQNLVVYRATTRGKTSKTTVVPGFCGKAENCGNGDVAAIAEVLPAKNLLCL